MNLPLAPLVACALIIALPSPEGFGAEPAPASPEAREKQMQAMIARVHDEHSTPEVLWRDLSDLAQLYKESHPLFAGFYGQMESARLRSLVLASMARLKMPGGETLAARVKSDPDPRARALGISTLMAVPAESPALWPAVQEYLGDTDPECRFLLGRLIASRPRLLGVVDREEMRKFVDDADPIVRQGFLANVTQGAESDAVVIPLLLEAALKPDPMTRMCAAAGLSRLQVFVGASAGQYAAEQARLVGLFIGDLGREDATAGGAAMYALVTLFGDAEKKAVEAALAAGAPMARARAAGILERKKVAFDPAPLRQVFEQGSEEAQLFVCGVLFRLAQEADVPLLEAALASPHSAVRQAAVYALEVHEMPAARQVLIEALDHADANVRYRSAIVLGRQKVEAALPKLEAMAGGDADAQIKNSAALAAAVAGQKDLSAGLVDSKKFFDDAATLPASKAPPVAGKPTELKDGVALIGTQKQLFVDDLVLDKMPGATRVLHQFQRDARNPILEEEVPWEPRGVMNFCGTVQYDPQTRVFTMWYTSTGSLPEPPRADPPFPESRRAQLLAYSTDGVHWLRPNLHLAELAGSTNNNLVGLSSNIVRWKDAPDPQRRFASYLYSAKLNAMGGAFSPDGLSHWSEAQRIVGGGKDVVTVCHDDLSDGYLAFIKSEVGKWGRRSATAKWGKTPEVIATGSTEIVAGFADDRGAAERAAMAYPAVKVMEPGTLNVQIYGVTPFIYEGMYFGLPQRFIFTGWGTAGEGVDGPVDICLFAGRDKDGAGNWTRPGGATPAYYPPPTPKTGVQTDERLVQAMHSVLPYGRFGEWDSGQVYGCSVLVVDDELVLYYLGADWGHGHRTNERNKNLRAGIGRATMRLDGFVSLSAGEQEAVITTKPAVFEGARMEINVACPQGALSVELLDTNGTPLPGFTRAEADAFTGDALRRVVTWQGKSDLSALAGQPIKVRFHLQRGDLYAFRCVPGQL